MNSGTSPPHNLPRGILLMLASIGMVPVSQLLAGFLIRLSFGAVIAVAGAGMAVLSLLTLSLPSVRALAEELRINRNTAAKAYAELEAEGVIETRAGKGCFLKTGAPSPLRRSVRAERLAEAVDSVIVQAHHLQISPGELTDLLAQRLQYFQQQQADRPE